MAPEEYKSPHDVLMTTNKIMRSPSVYSGIRPVWGDVGMRKSSFASFQNLSVGADTSVNDSEYSHYNPVVNEPVIYDNTDPSEKAMHAFLDSFGISQVNTSM